MPSATFGFLGNPESITVGTGSYTVPAGKYAYVTCTLSATAIGTDYTNTGLTEIITSSSNSNSASFWLPPGAVLNTSNTNASASTTTPGTVISSTSIATITINGSTALSCQAYMRVRCSTGAGREADIVGSTNAQYTVQVFPA